LERLQAAINLLIGTHDFSSFERSGSRDKNATDGRGAVRTLTHFSCFPLLTGTDCWSIRVTGDGFLRQMVRVLAGTLIEIGKGKHQPEVLADILEAKDRAAAGPTAPACGLFLEKIYYNPPIFGR
jgi:tRNA pseudouridine38-40 synthase